MKAAYRKDVNDVYQKWDQDILSNYKEDVEDKMYELKKKQEDEFATLNRGDKRSKSVLGHGSRAVLELRKKQECLKLFVNVLKIA